VTQFASAAESLPLAKQLWDLCHCSCGARSRARSRCEGAAPIPNGGRLKPTPGPRRCLLAVAVVPLGVVALLVWVLPVLAALTGDIRGSVLDPQNLPVEGAQVTVKNLDTGVSRVTATDSVGDFSALQLDVGNYAVRVEKSGFQAFLVNNVSVRSGQVAKVRMALVIGPVNQTVTVESGAEAYLDPASAQVATSLDAQTIEALPTLDRDPVALANLSPGVVPVSKDNLSFLESGNYDADGQRARSNNITVDNAIATDVVTSEQAGTGTFSLDSVQEVTLITSGLRRGIWAQFRLPGTDHHSRRRQPIPWNDVLVFAKDAALNARIISTPQARRRRSIRTYGDSAAAVLLSRTDYS